jgi:hypothetical protein
LIDLANRRTPRLLAKQQNQAHRNPITKRRDPRRIYRVPLADSTILALLELPHGPLVADRPDFDELRSLVESVSWSGRSMIEGAMADHQS